VSRKRVELSLCPESKASYIVFLFLRVDEVHEILLYLFIDRYYPHHRCDSSSTPGCERQKKTTKKNLKGFCEVMNLNDWSCSFQAHKILHKLFFLCCLIPSDSYHFSLGLLIALQKRNPFFFKLITQTT